MKQLFENNEKKNKGHGLSVWFPHVFARVISTVNATSPRRPRTNVHSCQAPWTLLQRIIVTLLFVPFVVPFSPLFGPGITVVCLTSCPLQCLIFTLVQVVSYTNKILAKICKNLSFLSFFLSFFLSCFLAFLLSCFLAFLLSCFLAFLLSLLPCFLACLLACFLPSFLPSFLFFLLSLLLILLF